jgi:1-aminocyclopropane-1-carboxylate deaminase
MSIENMLIPSDTPLQPVVYNGSHITVLRLDKIHASSSGNKFFKLKYNLEEAKNQKHNTLLTFGGAFSNHIYATAHAAKLCGFKSVGIIRGDRVENPTLDAAKAQGMKLHFMDRAEYRNKTSNEVIDKLRHQFGRFYLIPEGGTSPLAVKGTKEIAQLLPEEATLIPVPVGTGGTIAGLIQGLDAATEVLGISSLKGDFLTKEVASLLPHPYANWSINTDYHFGGYAKWKPDLIDFINDFYRNTNIPLDPVYTGKMLYAIFDLLEKGELDKNHKIVAIHTGGLQGITGFNKRFGDIIET